MSGEVNENLIPHYMSSETVIYECLLKIERKTFRVPEAVRFITDFTF